MLPINILERQYSIGPPWFPSNKIFPAFSEYGEVVESSYTQFEIRDENKDDPSSRLEAQNCLKAS